MVYGSEAGPHPLSLATDALDMVGETMLPNGRIPATEWAACCPPRGLARPGLLHDRAALLPTPGPLSTHNASGCRRCPTDGSRRRSASGIAKP